MDSSSALLPPSGKDQYYNNYPPRACLCIICFGIKIRTRTLPDCSINEYVLVWGRIFNYSRAFSSSSHPHTRTKKKKTVVTWRSRNGRWVCPIVCAFIHNYTLFEAQIEVCRRGRLPADRLKPTPPPGESLFWLPLTSARGFTEPLFYYVSCPADCGLGCVWGMTSASICPVHVIISGRRARSPGAALLGMSSVTRGGCCWCWCWCWAPPAAAHRCSHSAQSGGKHLQHTPRTTARIWSTSSSSSSHTSGWHAVIPLPRSF